MEQKEPIIVDEMSRHIILYSKGHYQESTEKDIVNFNRIKFGSTFTTSNLNVEETCYLEDLRTIVSKITMTPIEYTKELSIYRHMLKCLEYCNKYHLELFWHNLFSKYTSFTDFDSNGLSVISMNHMILKIAYLLSTIKVRHSEHVNGEFVIGDLIINLGEADENILPLKIHDEN